MPGSSAVHVIRLRDPWECELATESAGVPAQERPVREAESDADFPFAIRFRRRFGLPTGLKPEDQINLVIERITARGQVWLNDALLGEIVAGEKPARFSLCGRLQSRNLLLIEFTTQSEADDVLRRSTQAEITLGSLAGEVRLEIIAQSEQNTGG